MAWTTSHKKFDRFIANFSTLNNSQFKRQLDDCGEFSLWSQAYEQGYKYEVMKTNQSDVFNKVLKGVWSVPVTTIVKITVHV